MLVVDASAFTAAVAEGTERAARTRRLLRRDGHWVVPEHFVLEAASSFRGLWLGRVLDSDGLDRAFGRLAATPLDVWPTAPLLPRIRELAANATVYDAAYLALAEELGCPLVTTDAMLARVPGIRCRVLGADPGAG